MSLGYSQAWAQSSFAPSVVASRIISKGRIFTSAAGNDGDLGSWFTSGPASTPGIISVGSIDKYVCNSRLPVAPLILTFSLSTVGLFYNASVSNGRLIPYISFQDPRPLSIPAGLPLYATSSDITVTDDACNPLPPSTPDLSNRLVIIRRGTCSMYIKLDNAATFGAQYFLIYDNLDQKLGILQISEYNVSLISQQDGVFLVQQAIPQNLTLSFPDLSYNAPLPGGGLVSSFSTYGPTNDMYLKPAVSAPGGSILSTYPLSLGAYAILSGTSMSTPFVAGASALLLQVRGKTRETARAARSIFENTAVPVKQTASNTSLLEAASHQGAGLIQVFDAVKNTGSMLPAELLLNDTAHFNGVHRLLIKNGGKQSVTYSLSHVPAGTANTLNGIANNGELLTLAGAYMVTDGYNYPVGPVPLVPNAAEVTITPSTLTIPAGQALPVAVTFKPPTGLNPANFSVYSGYIKATGTDNTTLQSIYLGVAANLKEMKIIDHTDTLLGFKLPALVDYYGNPVPDSGSATFSMNDTDVPFLFYRLVGGTRLYRLDLIDAQTNDTHRSVEIEQQSHPTSPFPTLGLLYKAEYATRDQGSNPGDLSGVQVFPAYRFANGSAIPNGRYKILMQALKITGNLKERADYDTWASPVAVIKRA
jgi:subtilisin family serine protease